MDEGRFRAALAAKMDVSVRMAQVFQHEALDFVLCFSSLQSFSKSPGQSNYAAGCTFKDAFAHYLARHWACAVKVMNWGYWGGAGIVASQDYQARMTRAGVGSIEPDEAMDALTFLLNGPLEQVALMKTLDGQHTDGPGEGCDGLPGSLSPRERAGGQGPQGLVKAPHPVIKPSPDGEGKEEVSRNQSAGHWSSG